MLLKYLATSQNGWIVRSYEREDGDKDSTPAVEACFPDGSPGLTHVDSFYYPEFTTSRLMTEGTQPPRF